MILLAKASSISISRAPMRFWLNTMPITVKDWLLFPNVIKKKRKIYTTGMQIYMEAKSYSG